MNKRAASGKSRFGRGTALAIAASLCLTLVPSGTPAQAATAKEKRLKWLVNNYRENHGKSRLPMKKKLRNKAHAHAKAMATKGFLFHSTTSQLHNYMDVADCNNGVGENVGFHPSGKVGKMHAAFKQSPPHKAIMLKSYWKKIGVGVYTAGNGWIWVTELFCY
jgi:uncharacterized protein YkwD